MPPKGQATAERIEQAALKLFAARGYAAVSMRDIADAVGIRQGGLYNHFPTKQSILFGLLAGHMERLIAAWDESAAGGSAAERLTAFARFHIRFHFARPDKVFIAYMELRSLEPENFTAIERLRDRYEAGLRDILDELGQAEPAVAARALIAMLTGVTTWYRPGGRLSIGAVEALYVDMARGAVGLSPLSQEMELACSTAA